MHLPASLGRQEEVRAYPGHQGEGLLADEVPADLVKLARRECQEVHRALALSGEEEVLNLQVLGLPQHHQVRAAVPQPDDLTDIPPFITTKYEPFFGGLAIPFQAY